MYLSVITSHNLFIYSASWPLFIKIISYLIKSASSSCSFGAPLKVWQASFQDFHYISSWHYNITYSSSSPLVILVWSSAVQCSAVSALLCTNVNFCLMHFSTCSFSLARWLFRCLGHFFSFPPKEAKRNGTWQGRVGGSTNNSGRVLSTDASKKPQVEMVKCGFWGIAWKAMELPLKIWTLLPMCSLGNYAHKGHEYSDVCGFRQTNDANYI